MSLSIDNYILTSKGFKWVADMNEGKTYNIWNGCDFVPKKIKIIREEVPLLKVTYSNGNVVRYSKDIDPINTNYPAINPNKSFKNSFTRGVLASGLPDEDHMSIKVRDPKLMFKMNTKYWINEGSFYNVVCKGDYDRYEVPINCNIWSKASWLEGLISNSTEVDEEFVKITGPMTFLEDVSKLLQTCSINSEIKGYKLIINTYELRSLLIDIDCIDWEKVTPKESNQVYIKDYQECESNYTYVLVD